MTRRVAVLARSLAPLIPHGAEVLDVGCGDGQVARRIMQLRPDVRIRGIDVLLRPTSAIPVDRFDGSHIPVADAGVDIVMLVDVLHHVVDIASLLKEVARVARQGVVIKDHLREGFLAGPTLRVLDWVGNAPHGVVLAYNYLSLAEWEQLWAKADLQVEQWNTSLGLYRAPVSWVCERRLHFTARLAPLPPPQR